MPATGGFVPLQYAAPARFSHGADSAGYYNQPPLQGKAFEAEGVIYGYEWMKIRWLRSSTRLR